MGVKQIIHYGVDLALVSMILAGLRRSTSYVVAYEMSDLRNYIKQYLDWGEFLFDKLAQMAERSAYFRKQTPLDKFLADKRPGDA